MTSERLRELEKVLKQGEKLTEQINHLKNILKTEYLKFSSACLFTRVSYAYGDEKPIFQDLETGDIYDKHIDLAPEDFSENRKLFEDIMLAYVKEGLKAVLQVLESQFEDLD